MTWIEVRGEAQASGELATLYEQIRRSAGYVANLLQAHSLNPPALAGHLGLYRALMFGRSGLSHRQREMLAVVVSATNGCHY